MQYCYLVAHQRINLISMLLHKNQIPTKLAGGINQVLIQNHVAISISKGQFSTSFSENHISVKFDDKEKIIFQVVASNSGDSEVLLVRDPEKFIKHLKLTEKVQLQTVFYSHRSEIFEFDVDGFIWSH